MHQADACRASLEYFKILEDENLLERVRTLGAYFKKRLEELKDLPIVQEVRGEGLMLAVELKVPGKEIVKEAVEKTPLIMEHFPRGIDHLDEHAIDATAVGYAWFKTKSELFTGE